MIPKVPPFRATAMTADDYAEFNVHFARGDADRPYPQGEQRRAFTNPVLGEAIDRYHQSQHPGDLAELHEALLTKLPSSMRQSAKHLLATGHLTTNELDQPNAFYNEMRDPHPDIDSQNLRPSPHKGSAAIHRRNGNVHLIVGYDNDRGGLTRAIVTAPDDYPDDTSRPERTGRQDAATKRMNLLKRVRPVE